MGKAELCMGSSQMNGEGRVVYVKQPNEWGRQSCVWEAAKQD